MSKELTVMEGGEVSTRSTASVAVAETRAGQEVQAAMAIAQRFPRDQTAAFQRIMEACRRKSLAKDAVYAYPRGTEVISGETIKLMEVIVQNWGNIDAGLTEVEQREGESTMMAYCWDMQTNTRITQTFTVKHERHTRRGVKILTDPRDIYEVTANSGSRRLRKCMSRTIPTDIIEAAIAECTKTLQGDTSEPISDRVHAMVTAFAVFGVTQEMIEERLGHNLKSIIEQELVTLRQIYTSLNNDMATREQFFNIETKSGGVDGLKDKLKNGKGAKQPGEDPPPEPPKAKPPKINKPAEKAKDEPLTAGQQFAADEQADNNAACDHTAARAKEKGENESKDEPPLTAAGRFAMAESEFNGLGKVDIDAL